MYIEWGLRHHGFPSFRAEKMVLRFLDYGFVGERGERSAIEIPAIKVASPGGVTWLKR
jgi:hypothetical protein